MLSPVDERYIRVGSVLAPVTKPLKGGGGGGRPKGVPTDPHWSNVILLMKAEGWAHRDSSPVATDPSTPNSAQDSTIFKFGENSISTHNGGAGNGYITRTIPGATQVLGTGDFTVETFVRLFSITGSRMLYDNRGAWNDPAGFAFSVQDGAAAVYSNAAWQILPSPVVSALTWYHIAMSRNGSTIRVFVDGVLQGTWSSVTANFNQTGMSIGRDHTGGSSPLNGWIDEFRVTKGVGRYTANFTPPAATFPTS